MTPRARLELAGVIAFAVCLIALLLGVFHDRGPDPEKVEAERRLAAAEGATKALEERLTARDVVNEELRAALQRLGTQPAMVIRVESPAQSVKGPHVEPVIDPATGKATCPEPDFDADQTTEAVIARGEEDKDWWVIGMTEVNLVQKGGPWTKHLKFPWKQLAKGPDGKPAVEGNGTTVSFALAPAVVYRTPQPRTLASIGAGLGVNLQGFGWYVDGGICPAKFAVSNRFLEGRSCVEGRYTQLETDSIGTVGVRTQFGVGKSRALAAAIAPAP